MREYREMLCSIKINTKRDCRLIINGKLNNEPSKGDGMFLPAEACVLHVNHTKLNPACWLNDL